MNSDLEQEIESLVGDLPEGEKQRARDILRACQFQDAGDPVFGLLRYLQLRAKTRAASERPLAAGLARLAEEMDSRLWETRRLQWGFFVGCVLLPFLFGCVLAGGLLFHAARVHPAEMSNYLGLPGQYELVHDARLARLQSGGVELYVDEDESHLGVVLEGNLIKCGPATNGQAVLVFRKR
jgi:hypothetical protein